MTKMNVSAAVLAGGDSKRMKYDKSLMKLGSKTMIEQVVGILQELCNDIIVVTNTPQVYRDLLCDVRFVKDQIKTSEKNSFVGLYSGILAAKNEYTFVVACDMPFLNPILIEEMIKLIDGQDILLPTIGNYYQPLHAIYKKSCLGIAKNFLLADKYKISNLIDSDEMCVEKIDEDFISKYDPKMHSFLNINTYEEFLQAEKLYEHKTHDRNLT